MIAGSAPRAASGSTSSLIEAIDLVLAWIERGRRRSQLAALDRSLLGDLGISVADLGAECRKHFWQR